MNLLYISSWVKTSIRCPSLPLAVLFALKSVLNMYQILSVPSFFLDSCHLCAQWCLTAIICGSPSEGFLWLTRLVCRANRPLVLGS